MPLENIDHIVVVMMENRSLDNLLGWLYPASGPAPAAFVPPSNTAPYDGLKPDTYFNQLHGPSSPRVYASHPPKPWQPACPVPSEVPTPDPQEEFEHVTRQLFGDKAPQPGVPPDMSGFLCDYATTTAGDGCAGEIMDTFGPAEAGVINTLARSFAVSDRWFACAPTQTWPNRGFVHTGSSDGHINNEDYEPYTNDTIFNVLEAQGKSWGVFHDTTWVPSLTHIQFTALWDKLDHFRKFPEFKRLCRSTGERLPSYSFVEPRFVTEPGEWWRLFMPRYPSDYHPPHDVLRGERFLAEVYEAVRASPYRDRILLVITFDEHGGCYDHVPPPWGSVPPLPKPVATKNGFPFDRFGVRVPTILVSSYVKPGTVFRSEGDTPFDHTSILATLRDWGNLGLDPSPERFLPSPRIRSAPKLDGVLSGSVRVADWPAVRPPLRLLWKDTSRNIPLNGIQTSLIEHMRRADGHPRPAGAAPKDTLGTALDYLRARPR